MKIIFSRKGFDSSFGGHPSPIFEDNTMISLPIPGKSKINYGKLNFAANQENINMGKFLEKIGRVKSSHLAHLDPDIYPGMITRKEGWRASLGQVDAAQSHLAGQKIEVGDLFLFFGWFRRIRKVNKGWQWYGEHIHSLFGYLEIGEILHLGSKPKESDYCKIYPWLENHPHLTGSRSDNNTLYLASEKLSLDNKLPGGGSLGKFSEHLQLTAPGQAKSLWQVPNWLDNRLTYHKDEARWQKKENNLYLQTVAKGQEFVFTAEDKNQEINLWLDNLFKKSLAKKIKLTN